MFRKNQLVPSYTLKKEATGSCETLLNIYQTAQHHILIVTTVAAAALTYVALSV